MWAHALVAPGRFETVDVAAPSEADVPDGQVLLRALVGGICGSDLPAFRGTRHRDPRDLGGWAGKVPGLPLHEIVGEVLVSRHPEHRVGDLVVGWASRFDGIAELVLADGEGLYAYEASLTPVEAITIQPLACVLYAVEIIDPVPGERAVVLGQGPIGLLFSHVLNERGAVVTGVDRVDRTDVARVFGVAETATTTTDRWSGAVAETDRPPVVVEAIGHQIGSLLHALDAVAFGGQVYYFGVPDDPIYPISMQAMFRKNLTLRSGQTIDRRRVLREAGKYLLAHDELRSTYVSDVYPVGHVQRAFEAATAPKPGQFKIALDMRADAA